MLAVAHAASLGKSHQWTESCCKTSRVPLPGTRAEMMFCTYQIGMATYKYMAINKPRSSAGPALSFHLEHPKREPTLAAPAAA